MPTILTPSDFTGIIPNTDKDEVGAELVRLIAGKEPEFLTKALGYELTKNIPTGLKDGEDFTWYGILHKWGGLKLPIRNYVLFYWYRQNATQTTGIGEFIPNAENGTRTSPEQKQIFAWNEMVKEVRVMYAYMQTIGTYTFDQCRGNNELRVKLNPFGI